MNIIFIDKNHQFIDTIKNVFSQVPNVIAQTADIETISRIGTAFVSPANSFCLMSGGIDAIYNCRMFRGVENQVKDSLKHLHTVSRYGNKYLPIGSAIVTPITLTTCLISAPTMYLPHDVSKTMNAYHSFMAILCAFQQYCVYNPHITHLVCPALCIGYGKMPIDLSVNQIYQAYIDWTNHKIPPNDTFTNNPQLYITPFRHILDNQPHNYDEDEPFSVGTKT